MRIITVDFKKYDLLLIVVPPIILASVSNGYTYLGLVFIYATITGYFRYARN
jgi:hypothetical protein